MACYHKPLGLRRSSVSCLEDFRQRLGSMHLDIGIHFIWIQWFAHNFYALVFRFFPKHCWEFEDSHASSFSEVLHPLQAKCTSRCSQVAGPRDVNNREMAWLLKVRWSGRLVGIWKLCRSKGIYCLLCIVCTFCTSSFFLKGSMIDTPFCFARESRGIGDLLGRWMWQGLWRSCWLHYDLLNTSMWMIDDDRLWVKDSDYHHFALFASTAFSGFSRFEALATWMVSTVDHPHCRRFPGQPFKWTSLFLLARLSACRSLVCNQPFYDDRMRRRPPILASGDFLQT